MNKIRTMNRDDIEFALRITDAEGWDYCTEDFERLLSYEPNGCFIATEDSRPIGLTTSVNYGFIGWIGNVIVDPKARKKGVGNDLVAHTIDYLRGSGARSIRLNSYLDTRGFYSRMKFREDSQIGVFFSEEPRNIDGDVTPRIRKLDEGLLSEVETFDRKAFGSSREKLLRVAVRDFPHLCFASAGEEGVEGYIMANDCTNVVEIGPWVCGPNTNRESMASLFLSVLKNSRTKPSGVAIPEGNGLAEEMVRGFGFDMAYKVSMMCLSQEKEIIDPAIFALGSLAHG